MQGSIEPLGPLLSMGIPDAELLVDPGTSISVVVGVMVVASALLWLAQRPGVTPGRTRTHAIPDDLPMVERPPVSTNDLNKAA